MGGAGNYRPQNAMPRSNSVVASIRLLANTFGAELLGRTPASPYSQLGIAKLDRMETAKGR